MKANLFCTLFIIYFSSAIIAQDWLWAKKATYAGGSQQVLTIDTDISGNIYVLGVNSGRASYGSFELDSGTFLLKYSPSGSLLWAYSLSFDAKKMKVSGDKTIYLACNFKGGIFVNKQLHTSAGENDILIVSLDTQGQVVWSRHYGGTKDDKLNDLDTDMTGHLYLTGSYASDVITFYNPAQSDTSIYSQYFLTKIDGNANCVWFTKGLQDRKGYRYHRGLKITVDKFDRPYTIGVARTYIEDRIYETHFFTKYDKSGNLYQTKYWDQNYFGYDVDFLTVDDSLNVYYSSQWASPHSGNPDPQKFDSILNRKWAISGGIYYACFETHEPRPNPKGGVNVLATISRHSMGCDKDSVGMFSPLKFKLQGGADIVIIGLDDGGQVKWQKHTGGSGNEHPACSAFDKKGNFYVAGLFDGPVAFDDNYLWTSNGSRQVFLAKMGTKIIPPSITPTPSQFCELDIFPNPSEGELNISSNCHVDDLWVYNPLGALLFHTQNIGSEQVLDLSYLPVGVLVVKAVSQDRLIVKKLIIR